MINVYPSDPDIPAVADREHNPESNSVAGSGRKQRTHYPWGKGWGPGWDRPIEEDSSPEAQRGTAEEASDGERQ